MNVTRELEIMECPFCFITFGVPKRLLTAKQQNGTEFWCPNGHDLNFQENENAKLRRERDLLRQRLAMKDDQIAEANERTAAAQKEIDRLAKRANHGVCPCCKRTFSQLARHMKDKHPEFKAVQVVA